MSDKKDQTETLPLFNESQLKPQLLTEAPMPLEVVVEKE